MELALAVAGTTRAGALPVRGHYPCGDLLPGGYTNARRFVLFLNKKYQKSKAVLAVAEGRGAYAKQKELASLRQLFVLPLRPRPPSGR